MAFIARLFLTIFFSEFFFQYNIEQTWYWIVLDAFCIRLKKQYFSSTKMCFFAFLGTNEAYCRQHLHQSSIILREQKHEVILYFSKLLIFCLKASYWFRSGSRAVSAAVRNRSHRAASMICLFFFTFINSLPTTILLFAPELFIFKLLQNILHSSSWYWVAAIRNFLNDVCSC